MNDYPSYLIYVSQKHWGEKDLEVKKVMTLNKWLNSYLTASLYLLFQMDHKALTFSLNIYICPWILGLPTSCLHSLTFFFLHSHLSSFVSTLLRAAWWSDSLQIRSTSNLSVAPKRQASLLVFSDTKGLVFQKMPLFLRGLDGPGNPILSKRTLLTGTGKGTPSPLHSPSPFLTIVLSTQGTLST